MSRHDAPPTRPSVGSASGTGGNSPRWARLAAVAVVVLFVAGVAAGIAMKTAVGELGELVEHLPLLVAFGTFALIGAVIVARQPANTIGWLFAAIGLLVVPAVGIEEYVGHAVANADGDLPGLAVFGAWYQSWFWYPLITLVLVFVPLLFPTGRLPGRWWRPVLWVPLASVAAITGLAMVPERLTGQGYDLPNPVGIDGLAYVEQLPVLGVLSIGMLGGMVGGVAALIVRFRRAGRVERLQLKWFLSAVAFVVGTVLVMEVVDPPLPDGVENVLFGLIVTAIPVAAGVAVLRYRLYDIDRIVSRTVSYALLTALLVGVYAAGVVGLGGLARQLTGGGGDLAVAASTLAVAGLFGPARRRIQRGVDRRFNRARYDAGRTVEAFSQRLRDEVDLEEVAGGLRETVVGILGPRSVSVWIAASDAGP